jgi:hypothetical protein
MIERNRAFEVYGGSTTCGGELALLVAAGRDQFEAFDRSRLAIDAQLEVVFREPVDKVALLVKNHHVGLDEFRVNTYNVIVWLFRRRGRRLCRHNR